MDEKNGNEQFSRENPYESQEYLNQFNHQQQQQPYMYQGTPYMQYQQQPYQGNPYLQDQPSYENYPQPQIPSPSHDNFISKKAKENEKYKIQYFGMFFSSICAAVLLYFLYPSVSLIFNVLYKRNNFRDFNVILVQFPSALIYFAASYFFLKAILVPKYAGGWNPSKKFWPLAIFEYYMRSMLFFSIINWIIHLSTLLTQNLYRYGMLKKFLLKDSKTFYYSLAITTGKILVAHYYWNFSVFGDDEKLSFLKPWVVIKETETEIENQLN